MSVDRGVGVLRQSQGSRRRRESMLLRAPTFPLSKLLRLLGCLLRPSAASPRA